MYDYISITLEFVSLYSRTVPGEVPIIVLFHVTCNTFAFGVSPFRRLRNIVLAWWLPTQTHKSYVLDS